MAERGPFSAVPVYGKKPLSAGSEDVRQTPITFCRVFSSFWVMVSKTFFAGELYSIINCGLFCNPTQELWSPQTIHLNI